MRTGLSKKQKATNIYFNELYQLMNGMALRDMDKIIYPVCMLCRDHERSGFVEGIKIGIMLAHELR